MQTIGSLCSGIGGLDIAAEQHFGATLSWHSDIDQNANAVMAEHWPHAQGIGDFTKVDPSTLPPVSVLTAGFPCQPVSVAGLKKGTADERWLFDDIHAFIQELPQLPKVLVLENVQGFLSNNKGATARRVVGQVVSLGYRLRWGVVRASDTGQPHQRARWFGVATTTDADSLRAGRREHSEVPSPTKASEDESGWPQRERVRDDARHGGQTVTHSDDPRRKEQRRAIAVEEKHSPTQRGSSASWGPYSAAVETWEELFRAPPHPLVQDRLNPRLVEWMLGYNDDWTAVVSSRVQRLKLLGNSVSPQQARLALELLTNGSNS